MLPLVALLLLVPSQSPPRGFTVVRDTVTIERFFWLDDKGRRPLTDEPYLLIRFKVTNDSDHPIRWPGFRTAKVSYRDTVQNGANRTLVGGSLLPVSFGPGSRWENSLVPEELVQPGQRAEVLLVFRVPPVRGQGSLTVQWEGETRPWLMTIRSGFKIPSN